MAAMSNFWQRVITGVFFLIVMVGSIVWSFESFIIVFGIVTVLSTHEYLKITSIFSSPNKILVYIANIVSYILISIVVMCDFDKLCIPLKNILDAGYNISYIVILGMLFLFPALLVIGELFRKKEKPFENIAYSVLGFVYIAIPLILLTQEFSPYKKGYNFQIILAYFLLLWIADTFSYIWGKLLGKHKLAPSVSEGKTIEGSIGGILTTGGIAFLFPIFFKDVHFTTPQWVVFALLIALFAIPSDLSESLLKRQAGVKDSGKLLPGHGGILDRFDSVFLTAPVIYIYLKIISII